MFARKSLPSLSPLACDRKPHHSYHILTECNFTVVASLNLVEFFSLYQFTRMNRSIPDDLGIFSLGMAESGYRPS
ncbi:hypothetical protein WOLCODRAFT_27617 [Wolfiporia cocos MD-104 SS10]|uniref:Uncharacterized protein n=1 Tax=Wolfiporia cocos (strain MD-104) TaxID=742152 RepID=A0A2H3IYM9_WOLCO|nr:hypothetical protein WOLCODRAFT_27617 [Wolfiporia cocos MD-104 SS10]